MNSKEKIRLKLKIKSILSTSDNDYLNLDSSKQKIVVALAADYGNLGDVAITYAQTQFLKKEFPEAEIVDFPISDTFTKIKSLKKVINDNDIITIVGGGNTGDMYDDIEAARQFIIKHFPKNKIISFPQTIDFSDTSYGHKAFNRAINVYQKHNNLTLSAREQNSYQKYKKKFKNKVVFAPDIVLSLNLIEPQLSREGITFCMRKDDEKKLTSIEEKQLINSMKEYGEINFYDTHIDKNRMCIEEREEELKKIWDVFKRSKLVVTDRLHGMIFCAITGTPCIAIDNSNGKISGVCDAWLKDYNSIKVFKEFNLEKIIKEIEFIIKAKAFHKKNSYEELKNALNNK